MPIFTWSRPRNPFKIPTPIFRRSVPVLMFSLVSSLRCVKSRYIWNLSVILVSDKQIRIGILFTLTEESPLPPSSFSDDTEDSALVGAELVNKKNPLNKTSNTAVWKVQSKYNAWNESIRLWVNTDIWTKAHLFGDIPDQISTYDSHHAAQRHQCEITTLIHIPRPHCLTAKWEPNYTDHVPSPHDAGVVSAGTAVVTETAYHQLCGDCSVSTSYARSQVFVWSLWSNYQNFSS